MHGGGAQQPGRVLPDLMGKAHRLLLVHHFVLHQLGVAGNGRQGGFHASGIGKQNPNVDAEIELRTVNTNGMGFTRMIDAAFGYMVKHGGGHIAAITSVAGTKGLGMAPSYSAAKAFQNTYLQALEQLANMRKLHISFTAFIIRCAVVCTFISMG